MKGQTAIEYLMTYGWAILIILIVAGVLAYYGIFAPSGFLGPTARGFGQVQVLNPWSILATDGTITLNLENRVGGTIRISEVDMTVGGDATKRTVTTLTGNVGGTSTLNVTSGGKAIISGKPSNSWPGTYKAGDTYTAVITITYYYPFDAATNFTSTGTISGTYS